MYKFIMNQWVMRKIDADKVLSYVPKFLTIEQSEMILATEQIAIAE